MKFWDNLLLKLGALYIHTYTNHNHSDNIFYSSNVQVQLLCRRVPRQLHTTLALYIHNYTVLSGV